MNEDMAILEVMLELCEDENKDLKAEIETLYNYIGYLQQKNKDLHDEFVNLIRLDKRLN
jgi:hypothetical protein